MLIIFTQTIIPSNKMSDYTNICLICHTIQILDLPPKYPPPHLKQIFCIFHTQPLFCNCRMESPHWCLWQSMMQKMILSKMSHLLHSSCKTFISWVSFQQMCLPALHFTHPYLHLMIIHIIHEISWWGEGWSTLPWIFPCFAEDRLLWVSYSAFTQV